MCIEGEDANENYPQRSALSHRQLTVVAVTCDHFTKSANIQQVPSSFLENPSQIELPLSTWLDESFQAVTFVSYQGRLVSVKNRGNLREKRNSCWFSQFT
jgi:hypothetical protein